MYKYLQTVVLLLTLVCMALGQIGGRAKLSGAAKHGKPGTVTVGPLVAGDSVYSIGLVSNIRDGGAITASVLGTASQTILGTVSSCVQDTSGGWRRWCNIDFSSGTDGWVAEDRLRRASSTQGAKSVLLIRVLFSDHTGDSNPTDGSINSYVTDANTLFTSTSYGQITSVTGTIVPGNLTLPHNVAFYSALGVNDGMAAAILDDAHTLATAAGYNWTNYFHNVVWYPQDYGTGFQGLSLYRGTAITTQFQNNVYSVVPSLLDRFGMPERSNAWNSNDSTVFGSAGSSVPNGDPYDVYGTEQVSVAVGFNLYHKNLGAKWIPDANVHQVTTNGTYRIYAVDAETTITGGRFYGIRMPAHLNSGFCSTCTEYWIEYREDQGLLINWGGKQLLDMTPGTEIFDDAFLTVALSPWTDPSGHTISVSAAGGTSPKFVDVTIGGL